MSSIFLAAPTKYYNTTYINNNIYTKSEVDALIDDGDIHIDAYNNMGIISEPPPSVTTGNNNIMFG